MLSGWRRTNIHQRNTNLGGEWVNLKFRGWKDKGTRDAILFYVSILLLFYWGVRTNFNVNELLLGAVVYVLTGLSFFGGSKEGPDDGTEKNPQLDEDAKQNSERTRSSRDDNPRGGVFRFRVWPTKLRHGF
jgi:hypothetical protein